jgi:predicted DNA-binding WGR domain protein
MYHSPIQLDVFPTDVQMRRIVLARNMRRFYRLSVQRDLFGRASLVREWARIGFRGQMMVETHPDEGEAITALMKLAATKKRRGYVDSQGQFLKKRPSLGHLLFELVFAIWPIGKDPT